MTKETINTPRYWLWLLLTSQSIYLIFEFSFNARLVDSIFFSDSSYFDQLSVYGRCISGIGFTLVCYGYLKYNPIRSGGKTALYLLLIASLAFPIMFFGQEGLINYFVDKSSAEQRFHAQYLALLKKGLANNAVVLKGIEYEKEDIESPAVKTFISSLGFMTFFTPNYIQQVIRHSDQILTHIAHQKANKQVKETYPAYLDMRKDMQKTLLQYNKANHLYIEKLNKIPQQAETIWRDIILELQKQWTQIQKNNDRELIEDGLDALIDGREQYQLGKRTCLQQPFGQQICLSKIEAIYQKNMQSAFGKNVSANYWCQRIEGKIEVQWQGGNFVKKKQPDHLQCKHLKRSFLRQKMLSLKGIKDTYFDNWEAFVSSKTVADKVRQKLKTKDIHMPLNYRIHSHKGFIRGVVSELTRQLKKGFMTKAKTDFGEAIAPRLGQHAFFNQSFIQAPLKKHLHLATNHAPVSLSLSEMQFRDEILMPVITKKLKKERIRLLSNSRQFANGAEKADEGKQYVRSILVPPVAMGFSMFFALLNLSSVVAGVWLLSGGKPWLALTARITFLLALIILPLIFSGEIARTKTFQNIIHETEKSTGPVLSGFIIWLSSLQPVIYPVGYILADNLHIFTPLQEDNK